MPNRSPCRCPDPGCPPARRCSENRRVVGSARMIRPCKFNGCYVKASYKLVTWDRLTKSWQPQMWLCYLHALEAKERIPADRIGARIDRFARTRLPQRAWTG
jgi:hypothetical protein